jgi:predicted PurR-regulated permease PerM
MARNAPLLQLPGTTAPRTGPPSVSAQMTVLVILALAAALYFARDVLIPLTLSVLLAILLAPLVALLRRVRVGRVTAVLLAVVTAIAIVCAIGGLIGSQIVGLTDQVPIYAQTIDTKVGAVRSYATDKIDRAIGRLGYTVTQPGKSRRPSSAPASPSNDAPKPMPVEVHQPDPSPLQLAERYFSPILSPLGTIGIVFIVTIFILLQQDDLRDRLIRLFGSGDLRRTTVALDDGGRRLSRYFLTQLGLNMAFGTVIGTVLLLIGVPSPLLWGVLAGLLRFVPYVGSFIAALFAMALAAAVDPGWSMLLWTAGSFLVLEGVVGQLVEPLVYGNSTGLSPFSVVVSVIFWSWIWGPIGLILATPLTLCLVVLGRHVEHLEFLDILLGDRPPLTPVEGFYQRMLAGDQDEARDHAETLLKEHSLIDYYDQVALPGLELAAIDSHRGVLSVDQLARIKDTINELVADLSGHLAGKPETAEAGTRDARWLAATPILCVAGRGPLDEAVAAMLCQLLSKHGIGTRIAPYEAATRGNINHLQTDDIAMVCVSYLDVSSRNAHLRYLLQRLRQRMPTTPFVVGLWPSGDASAAEPVLRAEFGANYYAVTLQDAVEICVKAANLPEAASPIPALAAEA